MPSFVEPQLATQKSKPPEGDYLHDIEFDGYRAQCHLMRGQAKIFTRNVTTGRSGSRRSRRTLGESVAQAVAPKVLAQIGRLIGDELHSNWVSNAD